MIFADRTQTSFFVGGGGGSLDMSSSSTYVCDDIRSGYEICISKLVEYFYHTVLSYILSRKGQLVWFEAVRLASIVF